MLPGIQGSLTLTLMLMMMPMAMPLLTGQQEGLPLWRVWRLAGTARASAPPSLRAAPE